MPETDPAVPEPASVPGPSELQNVPETDPAVPELASVPGPSELQNVPETDPAVPEPASVPGPSELQNVPETDPAVPEPASVPDLPDWRPTTSESAVSCTLFIFKVLFLCHSNLTYFNSTKP